MMQAPLLLLLSPFVCLGIVALTSLIIFLVMWRGKQAVLQNLADTANAAANVEESPAADSRWAHTSPADNSQTDGTIETSACPACGGENYVSAGACAYCGRKL
jgi:hypothetical protein